jgi:peptidoglycan-N-acetylglucosamine deacetylase
MPEYSRLESRRRRRKGPNGATIAVVALVVLVVVVAGVWWMSSRTAHPSASAQGTAPQPSVTSASSSSPSKTTSKPASATTSASTAATVTAGPQDVAATEASARAVEKAAVPFPGAPSISPTTKSVNHLNPKHKYIAITLDDGYNYQPALLELFKQYDAHCTTFLIGSWAASHKADLKDMKAAGFEIANHSWSHPFLTKLSSAQVKSELTKTQKVLSSVTGNQAPYLRPPFGATNSSVKATAAGLGYRIVMWDRTFGDSGRGATPKKLYSNVMYSGGGVKPGDIILCHWGSKPSYEALKKILPDLKAQGYEFVTISELIADSK